MLDDMLKPFIPYMLTVGDISTEVYFRNGMIYIRDPACTGCLKYLEDYDPIKHKLELKALDTKKGDAIMANKQPTVYYIIDTLTGTQTRTVTKPLLFHNTDGKWNPLGLTKHECAVCTLYHVSYPSAPGAIRHSLDDGNEVVTRIDKHGTAEVFSTDPWAGSTYYLEEYDVSKDILVPFKAMGMPKQIKSDDLPITITTSANASIDDVREYTPATPRDNNAPKTHTPIDNTIRDTAAITHYLDQEQYADVSTETWRILAIALVNGLDTHELRQTISAILEIIRADTNKPTFTDEYLSQLSHRMVLAAKHIQDILGGVSTDGE